MSARADGEDELLKAEGMAKSKSKMIIASARRAFTKNKIKLRTSVERMASMNWSIPLLCSLLIVIGLSGTVASSPLSYGYTFTYTEILEKMFSYALKFYPRPIITCVVMGILMKLVFPNLLEIASSYRFSLYGYAIFIFVESLMRTSEEELLYESGDYTNIFAVGFLLGYVLYVSILAKEKSKSYGYIADLISMEFIIVGLYSGTYVRIILFSEAELLVLITFYIVTRRRKLSKFVRMIRRAIPVGLFLYIGMIVYICYIYISEQYYTSTIMDWYLIRQDWIRTLLSKAKLIGSAGNFASFDKSTAYLDYSECFVGFLADTFGWVAVIALLVLFILLFRTLFKGAERQPTQVDRNICMGCTIYILFQTM